MTRHIPTPRLQSPWDTWGREVEAQVRATGGWTGPYDEVLAWAADKLALGSARDREKRLRENWGTPAALVARWVRLHCLEMEVTAGRLVLKARPQPKRSAPPCPPSGPSLFPDLDLS